MCAGLIAYRLELGAQVGDRTKLDYYNKDEMVATSRMAA